jgi:hypothetical protein
VFLARHSASVLTVCILAARVCDGDCIAVHVEKRGNGYIVSRGEQGGSCATSPLIGVELNSGMLQCESCRTDNLCSHSSNSRSAVAVALDD